MPTPPRRAAGCLPRVRDGCENAHRPCARTILRERPECSCLPVLPTVLPALLRRHRGQQRSASFPGRRAKKVPRLVVLRGRSLGLPLELIEPIVRDSPQPLGCRRQGFEAQSQNFDRHVPGFIEEPYISPDGIGIPLLADGRDSIDATPDDRGPGSHRCGWACRCPCLPFSVASAATPAPRVWRQASRIAGWT